LRRSLGLADRFVVAYSGNLGRAHDADTILRAAQLSATDPDLIFLMIGGGANMRLLESRAREQGLTNFRFAPYQPRTALADALAAGDVHLVSLLPQMEGLIFPSKLYGILAAGRPVVFVGDPEGELSRVVRESDIGLSVAANNASGLLESLWKLREDTAMREGMCSRARELFERRYTLKAAVVRWQDVLARAASSSARSA
jgi:glycosyltransferase involved in cell wall biosynthesis